MICDEDKNATLTIARLLMANIHDSNRFIIIIINYVIIIRTSVIRKMNEKFNMNSKWTIS